MRRNKRLAAQWVIAAAAVTFIGTSAFAESRPSDETRRGGDGRGAIRRESRPDDGASRRGDDSRRNGAVERRSGSEIEVRADREERGDRGTVDRRGEGRIEREQRGGVDRRGESRVEGDRGAGRIDRRGESRAEGDRRNRGGDTWRGADSRSHDRNRDYSRNDRNRSSDRGYRSDHRYGNRQPYYHSGRVSRYARYGNGYRVWVTGCTAPFYVPLALWHRDRFRVGVSIHIGGYYNDLGYYDYYDGRDSSRGDIRGVVESVDYRRDTFIVRNDRTGSFVTVVMRDRRRDVRAGDYVELYGEWSRSGVFHAYDVDLLDYDREYRRY